MAKNFKIADIDRNALYRVSTIDNWDGHAETREMTGAGLISFTNAAAHLYDIHAEPIATYTTNINTRCAIEVCGYAPHRCFCLKSVTTTGTTPIDGKRYRTEDLARAAAVALGLDVFAVGDFYEIMHAARNAHR